jgi:periplasmic copper chaperone A
LTWPGAVDTLKYEQGRKSVMWTPLSKSSALAVLALLTMFAGPAAAQDVKVGDLILSHAWSRATPRGAHIGSGYLTIQNTGTSADKLVGGSTQVAADIEVHEMAMKNDVMTMRHVAGGLTIPPGQSITLAPGGYHLMLMKLNVPLKEGDRVPLTLQFEKAGKVDVVLDVRGIGAGADSAPMDDKMPAMQKPMQMSPDRKM